MNAATISAMGGPNVAPEKTKNGVRHSLNKLAHSINGAFQRDPNTSRTKHVIDAAGDVAKDSANLLLELIKRITQLIISLLKGVKESAKSLMGISSNEADKKGQEQGQRNEFGPKLKDDAKPSEAPMGAHFAQNNEVEDAVWKDIPEREWEVVDEIVGDELKNFEAKNPELPFRPTKLIPGSQEDRMAAAAVAAIEQGLTERMKDPQVRTLLLAAAQHEDPSKLDEAVEQVLMEPALEEVRQMSNDVRSSLSEGIINVLREIGAPNSGEAITEAAVAITESLPENIAHHILAPEQSAAVTQFLQKKAATVETLAAMHAVLGQRSNLFQGTFDPLKERAQSSDLPSLWSPNGYRLTGKADDLTQEYDGQSNSDLGARPKL